MTIARASKKEPYFPFTQAIYEALIAADLTAAEWRFWGYLVTLDPFGNGAKYDPAEAMVKCGLGKSTYFRAKGKLQKLGFNFKDGATKVINLNGVRSQSEKLDSQSEKLDSAIYIDRAGDQSISNSSKTYSNSFQMEECASEHENFASLRSEPSEPVSATPLAERQVPVNSPSVAASHIAEDQFSAAPIASVEKNWNLKSPHWAIEEAEWKLDLRHYRPSMVRAVFESYSTGNVFVLPSGEPNTNAINHHIRKLESMAQVLFGQACIDARARLLDYWDLAQQIEAREAQRPVATPAPEPEALPAQQPALAPEEARSQFLKNAQRLWWAGGASRGIALKSCKTHGFLVDPDTGPYDPALESFDDWEDTPPTEPDPAIAAQIRESLGFHRPVALFVNPNTELGDWEDAV